MSGLGGDRVWRHRYKKTGVYWFSTLAPSHMLDGALYDSEEMAPVSELDVAKGFHKVAVAQRDAAWREIEGVRALLLEVTDALAEMIGEQSHDPETDTLVVRARACLAGAPARVPMTEAECQRLCDGIQGSGRFAFKLIRAVEAFHDIPPKEKP